MPFLSKKNEYILFYVHFMILNTLLKMDCDIRQVKRLFLNIISDVCEYDDFDKKLSKMDKKDKGHLFELFYKLYFTLMPQCRSQCSDVYLY